MTDTLKPKVLWAQRKDRLLVSIELDEVTDEQISVDNTQLTFSANSHNKKYSVDLKFYNEIVPEDSKQRKGGREYYFDLKKKESGPFWPRLLEDKAKHQYIKVDFNRWRDEDEDDDEGGMYDDANLEDMMQQMGTGNSFDPEDIPDSDDSDDEEMPDLEK